MAVPLPFWRVVVVEVSLFGSVPWVRNGASV